MKTVLATILVLAFANVSAWTAESSSGKENRKTPPMQDVLASDWIPRRPELPRIVREDEDVILLEDGREIDRRFVDSGGEERENISKAVVQKLLAKVGLESLTALHDNNLRLRYHEERVKLIKVKKLDRPRLRFLNKKGIAVKEMLLGDEQQTVAGRDWRGEATQIKVWASKVAKVARNGQYALIIDCWPKDNEDLYCELRYFDVVGRELWKKDVPADMNVYGIVSDDGSTVFIVEALSELLRADVPDQPKDKFVAIDRNGLELLAFPNPDKVASNIRLAGEAMVASPNGHYAAVRDAHSGGVVLFDVLQRSYWRFADKQVSPFSVSNDGICDVNVHGVSLEDSLQSIDIKTGPFVRVK